MCARRSSSSQRRFPFRIPPPGSRSSALLTSIDSRPLVPKAQYPRQAVLSEAQLSAVAAAKEVYTHTPTPPSRNGSVVSQPLSQSSAALIRGDRLAMKTGSLRSRTQPTRSGPPPGVVNYNDLMLQANASGGATSATASTQRGAATSYPSPQEETRPLVAGSSAPAGQYASHGEGRVPTNPSANTISAGAERHAGSSSQAGATTGFMEGPLPSEVREIIYSSCAGEEVEEAERQARRLLSTNRRVKVYRDELLAASEEVGDLEAINERQDVVTGTLRDEIGDINRRIEALLQERQLCEMQLQQEENVTQRQREKLSEARERVDVLRRTVENVVNEMQTGFMTLRQLVPNLHIDNYS